MKNKSISSSNRGFAGWIEDFITGLADKEAAVQTEVAEEKEEVLAEINLQDLDKVVWKEESFGVHFDEKGASLINEFGNVVRTLQDAKTVEEVDQTLNGNEIVVAGVEEEEDDLQEELAKIADSLDSNNCSICGKPAFSAHMGEPTCGDNECAQAIEEDNEDNAIHAEIEEEEEDQVVAAIANGFEELEATIATLSERLSTVEQQYARSNEVVNLSDNSQEEEIKHFTETADETAKEVAHENSVDLTSPAGRIELSQHTEVSEVQDLVTEEAPVATEAPVTEVPEEVSKEEVSKEEAPVEEETTEEIPAEKEEEVKTAEIVEEDIDDEDSDEVAVEKLAGAAEKIFQKGVCPETGEELVKSKTVNNFLGVYSSAGTEYAVDLSSGDIYKYLK